MLTFCGAADGSGGSGSFGSLAAAGWNTGFGVAGACTGRIPTNRRVPLATATDAIASPIAVYLAPMAAKTSPVHATIPRNRPAVQYPFTALGMSNRLVSTSPASKWIVHNQR